MGSRREPGRIVEPVAMIKQAAGIDEVEFNVQIGERISSVRTTGDRAGENHEPDVRIGCGPSLHVVEKQPVGSYG
jgi:hypothetical protein